MARYIDADALIEKYERVIKDPWNKNSAPTSWASAWEDGIADINDMPTADVVPKTDLDLLKSTITHKEEEAYKKGYEDAKADILEKLQADIARDEILAEYGDEFFEGRIAGFKAVINYLNAEDEE